MLTSNVIRIILRYNMKTYKLILWRIQWYLYLLIYNFTSSNTNILTVFHLHFGYFRKTLILYKIKIRLLKLRHLTEALPIRCKAIISYTLFLCESFTVSIFISWLRILLGIFYKDWWFISTNTKWNNRFNLSYIFSNWLSLMRILSVCILNPPYSRFFPFSLISQSLNDAHPWFITKNYQHWAPFIRVTNHSCWFEYEEHS